MKKGPFIANLSLYLVVFIVKLHCTCNNITILYAYLFVLCKNQENLKNPSKNPRTLLYMVSTKLSSLNICKNLFLGGKWLNTLLCIFIYFFMFQVLFILHFHMSFLFLIVIFMNYHTWSLYLYKQVLNVFNMFVEFYKISQNMCQCCK